MNRSRGFRFQQTAPAILAACAALLLVPGLHADDNAQGPRAVRLSSVDGQVSLSQNNQPLVNLAVANTPLFEGTQITTGEDGKAEIQFDDGSLARLSPAGSFTLAALRGDTEIVVNGGLAYFELQGDSQSGHFRVRFGDSVVTANGFTVLRINLDTPPGELAVFTGNAHLERAGGTVVDVHGGESLAWDASEPSHYNLAETIEPDSWDAWNSDRDQALSASDSGRSAAAMGMTDNKNPAWGDLDQNGSWYDVPDQGYVWSPYEASSGSWDPYGSGYWMSGDGYGTAWISGEPWGYMPYNCGTWNYYNSFGWGWASGGCRTWWGGGGRWRSNIGVAPPGYLRPLPPQHPHGLRPMLPNTGGSRLIAVNRHVPFGVNALPSRRSNTPVTIAGGTVQALRPLPTRPAYGSSFVAGASRPSISYNSASGFTRPAYIRPANPTVPGFSSNGYIHNSTGYTYSHPSVPAHVSGGSAPASHPSGGGGASHPSGGGGGGGGAHVSGGGGGGGSHH
jgi:hypothetical protein